MSLDKGFAWMHDGKELIQSVRLENKTYDTKEISAEDALGGYKYILILYTSSWCPGCRHFNDTLKDCYVEWNKDGERNIQVILVSCDRDDD